MNQNKNNEEAFSNRMNRKKNFPRYRLDDLTTELWETHGERGHGELK